MDSPKMGDGWVKAHRKLQEHPSWNHDGMLKLWLHCLFEANFKNSQYLIPGTTDSVEIARGSFVTGREKLRTGLYPHPNSDTPCARTIYRWLESLERMKCVTLRTVSNRCTIVTVCNYETYQMSEAGQCPPDVPPVSNRCPTDVPPVSTSEELKNVKNGKNQRSNTGAFAPPTLEQVVAYCIERKNSVDPQAWVDHYTSNGWMVGKSKMKDWQAAVRTWEKNRSLFSGNPNSRPSLAGGPGQTHDPKAAVTNPDFGKM